MESVEAKHVAPPSDHIQGKSQKHRNRNRHSTSQHRIARASLDVVLQLHDNVYTLNMYLKIQSFRIGKTTRN